ncbi:MAG: NADH-quinone oxidoreductase subunit J [Chloroflexi bacterium]|nr:NADH-quinone oxidoreductase subunit J [Chloroflexota bacterium]
MSIEQIAFAVLSAAAVIGGLGTILARNPIHCGTALVFAFFNIAGLFVLASAEFLAMAMMIIYGGAVMVLVVFVVMLVRMDDLPEMHPGHPVQMIVAPVVGVAAFVEVVLATTVVGGFPVGQAGVWTPAATQAVGGTTQAFGRVLYNEYLFPFVVVSLVLLVAAIGAIALARQPGAADAEGAAGISLSQARARLAMDRVEQLARARGGPVDAAALANAALEQTPAARQERE